MDIIIEVIYFLDITTQTISRAKERILYANFIQVNKDKDVKDMINEIFQKKKAI